MDNTQFKTPSSPNPGEASDGPGTQKKIQFRRDSERFINLYANNVMVESHAFDLRLIFGLTDLRNPLEPVVDQIAGVNISWPEVKLLIYYMQLHLAGHERENGKVGIPVSALPAQFPETPPPPYDNPQGREAFAMLRKMRDEFIANLSEP